VAQDVNNGVRCIENSSLWTKIVNGDEGSLHNKGLEVALREYKVRVREDVVAEMPKSFAESMFEDEEETKR
jgi:hypothetical protein